MSKRTLYLLAGTFLFLLHTLADLPLLTVLKWSGADEADLRWHKAEGTVWFGTIESAAYREYDLGTVNLKTFFLPLLTGRVVMQFAVNGDALVAEGKVSAGLTGKQTLTDVRVLMDLGRYNIRDAFDAPMSGALRLDIENLVVDDRVCEAGDFALWTDSLKATARRYGGNGFPLAGEGYCQDGAMILPVSGSGEAEDVDVRIVLESNLDYLAEVRVRSGTPNLVNALRLYGFDNQGDQLVMIQRGNLLINP